MLGYPIFPVYAYVSVSVCVFVLYILSCTLLMAVHCGIDKCIRINIDRINTNLVDFMVYLHIDISIENLLSIDRVATIFTNNQQWNWKEADHTIILVIAFYQTRGIFQSHEILLTMSENVIWYDVFYRCRHLNDDICSMISYYNQGQFECIFCCTST